MEKVFTNGFASWQETHFEVVCEIRRIWGDDNFEYKNFGGVVLERYEAQGTGGLYELAQELTDEFELLNKDREWNGEFFCEIEGFLKEKLKADA